MNKSFPTVPLLPARLRGLFLMSALALSGCATYYPDSGYGTVYESRSDDGYYSGGSRGYGDGRYYDDGYYGPAYGPTTIYYERYSPGYYYRPGYGYYVPAPRYRDRDRDYDHDHDRGDDRDRDRGWVNKGRELTGQNPSRERPRNRDDDRDDGRRSGWSGGNRDDRDDRDGRGGRGERPGYPVQQQPSPGNSRGAESDRGWVGRGRQAESRESAGPQRQAQPQPMQAPQPPPENRSRPKKENRGWVNKGKEAEDDR